jgi:hypothetical protein
MCCQTGASILVLRVSKAWKEVLYLALACNCHSPVECDSIEFRARNNSQHWVGDYNRKVLNLPTKGGMQKAINDIFILMGNV